MYDNGTEQKGATKMNTQLISHFLSMQVNTSVMPKAAANDIVTTLDKHFGSQYAWEISDEKLIMDNTMVSTTVTVYIPGRVLTGRSLSKIKEYGDNHLRALVDACSVIMDNMQGKNESKIGDTTPQSYSMTPDQIMSMVNQNNAAPKPEVAQVNNNQGSCDTSIFDNLPFTMDPNGYGDAYMTQSDDQYFYGGQEDNAPNVPHMQSTSQPQQQAPLNTSNNIEYTQPNPALNGYSQCQVDRMNRVKNDLDIVNDTMLGSWIGTWNSAFTSKRDLNPMNIDDFLDWAENFSKNL